VERFLRHGSSPIGDRADRGREERRASRGRRAALWSNFVAIGASRLLLSALVEQRSDVHLVSEAIPAAAITVVRLHASMAALEQRIRLRELASLEEDLVGARWWTQHFSEVRVEDHVVETENRSIGQIAREVLRLAAWLP
jgi:hypothetical protein